MAHIFIPTFSAEITTSIEMKNGLIAQSLIARWLG
jgi:hypothetical protein